MAKLREKVVLAYSGGLDTIAIIPWLREHFDYEVICCYVDCDQDNGLSDLEERAKLTDASKLHLFDENDSFTDDYILPCLWAGLDTEQAALLSNALPRPLITQRLVGLARKERAVAICHDATGKGNDQARFELSVKALAPELKVITSWCMTELWPSHSRENGLAYCRQKGIDLPSDVSHAYSYNRNLWHSSHEGLELEDPAQEPVFEELLWFGVPPKQAPDTETLLRIGFGEGVPVSLDGKRMKFSDLLRKLNEIGGKDGIDAFDIVEDRVVGMKVRGIYETPGIAISPEVKRSLETLVLDGDTLATRRLLDERYAPPLYAGKWFISLREALRASSASTQSTVSDEVRLHLYKDNLIRVSAGSVSSFYAEDVASFMIGSLYRHRDADGFIALFGLLFEPHARMLQRAGVAEEESALIELLALPLPVKTTVSKVKKADKKQAVDKVVEKKKSDERTPEKKKTVKREIAKKIAEKKTGVKKVMRKTSKEAPEKK